MPKKLNLYENTYCWDQICTNSSVMDSFNQSFPYTFIVNSQDNTTVLSEGLRELIDLMPNRKDGTLTLNCLSPYFIDNSYTDILANIQNVLSDNSLIVDSPIVFCANKKITNMLLRLSSINVLGSSSYILGVLIPNIEMPTTKNTSSQSDLSKMALVNDYIIDSMCDYLFKYDINKDEITFFPQSADFLALDEMTFGNVYETCLSLIHPDDHQKLIDSITKYSCEDCKQFTLEIRSISRSGEITWLSCSGKIINEDVNESPIFAGFIEDINQKKKHEKNLEDMINRDQLTGLYNLYRFNSDMQDVFKSDIPSTGAVVYMDIDDFKVFNDLFGHSFGNRILTNVSLLLKRHSEDGVSLYRLGGDEFVMHWPDGTCDKLAEVMKGIFKELSQPTIIDGKTVYITLSAGVAFYPEHGYDEQIILKSADIAMYSAKHSGKNTFTNYIDTDHNFIQRRFIIESELRNAIDHGFQGFRVFFQPLVDAQTGNWMGGEALLRWNSPTFGAIPPLQVVEILEYIKLMSKVGEWILRESVKECAIWHEMGCIESYVHVNMSAVQLEDHNFRQIALDILKDYNFPAECLWLELTETCLIKNVEYAMNFCKQMLHDGINISLDDFGIGYSSLSYLRELPLNQLKVDKAFLVNFTNDAYNRSIVSTVCGLAHSINLNYCVEGVETKELWDQLKSMNVDTLQGYHFGKPMPAEEFRAKLLVNYVYEENA